MGARLQPVGTSNNKDLGQDSQLLEPEQKEGFDLPDAMTERD